MDPTQRIRPSLWHCAWGVLILLIGAGSFGYTLFHGLTHATDSLTQIVVPGSAQLHLQPGSYTVFLEEQSVVDGKIYSATQSINGLSCRVNAARDGASVALTKPTTNTTYSVNGREGHSVLAFPIKQAGTYTFACAYDENVKGPNTVVAVGSGVGAAITRTVLGGLVEFFGGGVAGVAAIVFVIVRREREKKKLRQVSLPNTAHP